MGKRWTGKPKPCKRCGESFWCPPSQDVGGTLAEKKFCSNQCYHEWRNSEEGMLERFWANVVKSDGCWEYQTLNAEGYGIISQGYGESRTQYLAHRYAWKVYYGELPPADKAICHRCDNPPCVRREHLFVGTWAENKADSVAKGRQPRGERIKRNKITEVQARNILALKPPHYPRRTIGLAKQVAADHNICMGSVHAIWRGDAWRHIQFAASVSVSKEK